MDDLRRAWMVLGVGGAPASKLVRRRKWRRQTDELSRPPDAVECHQKKAAQAALETRAGRGRAEGKGQRLQAALRR
jgi:hypothetical protein